MEIEPLSRRVVEVKYENLMWGFTQKDPYFLAGTMVKPEDRADTSRQMAVNPRPAYPHDRELVERELAAAEIAFPVTRSPLMYLPHFDADLSTRNAATFEENLFREPQDEHGRTLTRSFMILYGKGTPCHPAMTRYLVAHEYGHVVCETLAWQHNCTMNYRSYFLRYYAEMRGMTNLPAHYGATSWHLHPEEIFANDFRIMVLQKEVEFWPHPTVPRPEEVPVLAKWWPMRTAEALRGLKHFAE